MPATKAAQDQWFRGAVGRYMNPDNYAGWQCKDVADDYCTTLFGNWVNTIRPGDGKDAFNNANSSFFTKFKNDWSKPSQIPQRGDIITWGASRAVPEGHIAVVESADRHGVSVIQQDGYLQVAAHRRRLPYVLPNGAACIGWLRPKLTPPKKLATKNEIQAAYKQYLDRPASQSDIDHYTRYTIDFVRADLQNKKEYRDRQARIAREAQAKADAAQRAAAEAAERQRIAEELAAAERLKQQAEEQARAAEAAKKAAEEAAKLPLPPPIIEQPKPTLPDPAPPAKGTSPLVLFLSALVTAAIQTFRNKKE